MYSIERRISAVCSLSVLIHISKGWDYTDPSTWTSVSHICGSTSQSPIDLVESSMTADTSLGAFNFTGHTTSLTETMKNNGHTVQVDVANTPITVSGGGLGAEFSVAQFHFHWGNDSSRGSEHTLNGAQYPMEMHVVTFRSSYGNLSAAVNQSDGLAVFGFFFEVDSTGSNTNFASIEAELSNVQWKDNTTSVSGFTLSSLMGSSLTDYFRYKGSLTTPDCHESVTWTVFKTPLKMNETQLENFRNLYEDSSHHLYNNYRPVQALNSRTVKKSATALACNIHLDYLLITCVALQCLFWKF